MLAQERITKITYYIHEKISFISSMGALELDSMLRHLIN